MVVHKSNTVKHSMSPTHHGSLHYVEKVFYVIKHNGMDTVLYRVKKLNLLS